MDTRKRARGEFANGGLKKSKPEMDSLSSGIGSKSKPCTKFFSMAGCPFGENCHFLHFFTGGYNAVAQMMNLTPAPAPAPATRTVAAGPPMVQNGSSPAAVKTKICNRYKTAEGCKFGDKCHFAHGEWELGKPIVPIQEDPRAAAFGPIPSRFGGPVSAPAPTTAPAPVPAPSFGAPPAGLAASFGASATAKISVDASLAGAIIGKGGVNSKQICRQTGAKLSIREHETDPNLRNIELEGSFEQIKDASTMVRELIVSISSAGGLVKALGGPGGAGPPAPGSNYKTKLCENFSKGSCTFGHRCHFAHGAAELRKTSI